MHLSVTGRQAIRDLIEAFDVARTRPENPPTEEDQAILEFAVTAAIENILTDAFEQFRLTRK